MTNKIKCILLVDDNPDDNFYHERVIKKSDAADIVVAKQTAMAALEYLKFLATSWSIPQLDKASNVSCHVYKIV